VQLTWTVISIRVKAFGPRVYFILWTGMRVVQFTTLRFASYFNVVTDMSFVMHVLLTVDPESMVLALWQRVSPHCFFKTHTHTHTHTHMYILCEKPPTEMKTFKRYLSFACKLQHCSSSFLRTTPIGQCKQV